MPRERINIAPTSGTSRTAGVALTETLTGSRTITLAEINTYSYFHLDPGGSARTVTLPAEEASKGAEIKIKNTADAAEAITVNDDSATAVMTISQDEASLLWCDGTTWHGGALPETVGAVAPGEITLARGSVLRGNSSGVAAAHDAKTSGQVLVGDGTDVVSVAVSGDITLAANGTVAIAAGVVVGGDVANVANANVVGGLPVLHRVTIPDAAGDTTVVLTNKTRVLDFWFVKTAANGGAGDTITLKNVATAITDALDLTTATDKKIVRATTIDDAQHEIAAGANMVISAAKVTSCGGEAYVLGVRVA